MKVNIRILFSFIVILYSSCNNSPKNDNQPSQKMSVMKAIYIPGTSALLGEGSIWDHRRKVLYWIDIQGNRLFEYDPVSETNTSWELWQNVGTIVPESNNSVIVALKDGLYRKFFSPDSLEFIAKPSTLKDEERFNDGKCDPAGRLWVGSMRVNGKTGDSHLYKYDPSHGFSEMIDSVSISNGITWSLNGEKMYYIDTPTRRIMQYDFDMETGEIRNPLISVEIPDSLGFPDGMTIDEEGKLWVGMWGGNAVCRFDPQNGRLLQRIEVPARNVTSCAFGGEDLETLYITTASIGMNEEQRMQFPQAGGLFKIKPGIKGIKSNFYKSE